MDALAGSDCIQQLIYTYSCLVPRLVVGLRWLAWPTWLANGMPQYVTLHTTRDSRGEHWLATGRIVCLLIVHKQTPAEMLHMMCISERTVWRYLSLFEKKR